MGESEKRGEWRRRRVSEDRKKGIVVNPLHCIHDRQRNTLCRVRPVQMRGCQTEATAKFIRFAAPVVPLECKGLFKVHNNTKREEDGHLSSSMGNFITTHDDELEPPLFSTGKLTRMSFFKRNLMKLTK